jgi:hypothetical protein
LVYSEQDFYPYKDRGQKPRKKVEKKFFQTCPKKNRKKVFWEMDGRRGW